MTERTSVATGDLDSSGAGGPDSAPEEPMRRIAGAPAPGGDDPRDEEVRVALALNGGVSLAVWMGGCAVELDCARRAHLGPELPEPAKSSELPEALQPTELPEAREPLEPPEAPEPTEAGAPPLATRSVYHGLCQALGRVLVLDIMSGASAGGINGGLLAAAIRHAGWLPSGFIRDRWLDLGDASTLLQRISEPSPRAFMQGQLFYEDLRATFGSIVGPEGDPSGRGRRRANGDPAPVGAGRGGDPTRPPSSQERLSELDVELVVTTTNLVGEPRTFRDYWGQQLSAREYRGRFHFHNRSDYTAETLAAASRSSASFPFAFEPWHVQGAAGTLADFPQARWVVDGGLLDNAPIADALKLIPTRTAQRQVQRFLCYVNAEPVEAPDLSAGAGEPSLGKVMGAVMSLPRKAPFVDQLYAIEQATRNSRLGGELPELDLLSAELGAVQATAGALLASYRRKRLLLSAEELIEQAGDAQRWLERESSATELPWLPRSLEPTRDGSWQWGISAVHRTIQLTIDLLSRSMRDGDMANPYRTVPVPVGKRLRLLAARQDMDGPLLAVEGMMDCLLKRSPADLPPGTAIERAVEEMSMFDPVPQLRAVAGAAYGVADLLDPAIAAGLFGAGRGEEWSGGEGELPQAAFEHFLRRLLAVEVLRRSLASGDAVRSTQELRFAQITPYAPSPIFTSEPGESDGWTCPEDKLLGLGLGHFAGFYRRSWRANDYMWGRLDAAARVVDLLVSPERAKQLAEDGADPPPWQTLADSLLMAEPAEVQLWLLEEVIAPGSIAVAESTDLAGRRAALRPPLVAALQTDLMGDSSDGGALTRMLFTRAAQAEIVAGEIAPLKQESAKDEGLGAGSKALQLSDDLRTAIVELRQRPSLPERLTGEDEIGSDLAVQTGTQAGLVGLAMLRTAGVPLNRGLFLLRTPLLLASSMVARRALYRAAALAVYWALSLFLASRLLTIEKGGEPTIGLLRSTAEAMTLVAVVGIAGMTLVPALRAWRVSTWPRRLLEAAWAVGLLGAGMVAAVLLARYGGKLSWEFLLTAPGASSPSATVLGICLALALGTPLAGIAAAARGAGDAVVRSRSGGIVAAVAVILVALALIAATCEPVVSAFGAHAWWQVTIAALSVIAAPLCAAGYLFRRR